MGDTLSKRFTDTDRWDDEWFQNLAPMMKLLACFLWDHLDHAGIWKQNRGLAEFKLKGQIHWSQVPALFKGRIFIRGDYWFVPRFLTKQYGDDLNRGDAVKSAVVRADVLGFSTVAVSIIGNSYRRVLGLSKESAVTATAKATAKAKAKDREGEGEGAAAFDALWNQYPRKLGRSDALRHFNAQVKTLEDLAAIKKALANYIAHLRKKGTEEDFIPHGSTWFNNRWRDWITYSGTTLPPAPKQAPVFKKPEILPPDPTAADLKDMHDAKVAKLGVCRVKDCVFCTSTESKEIANEHSG